MGFLCQAFWPEWWKPAFSEQVGVLRSPRSPKQSLFSLTPSPPRCSSLSKASTCRTPHLDEALTVPAMGPVEKSKPK